MVSLCGPKPSSRFCLSVVPGLFKRWALDLVLCLVLSLVLVLVLGLYLGLAECLVLANQLVGSPFRNLTTSQKIRYPRRKREQVDSRMKCMFKNLLKKVI